MEQILAVVIQVAIATSVHLCGKGRVVGWWIGLGVQVLNATYGVLTEHWGFLLGLVLVGPQFLKNALAWQRRRKNDQSLIVT